MIGALGWMHRQTVDIEHRHARPLEDVADLPRRSTLAAAPEELDQGTHGRTMGAVHCSTLVIKFVVHH